MKIMNPREWPTLRLEEVDFHRLDHCPFYGDCLDLAAKERWTGFTCSFCSVYENNMGKVFFGDTWEGEIEES